ncbi:Protein N-acetyltransferase, RimJ/RimL family [Streptomyces sp. MnatMP-M77]|uniref:GNAT family N-acetyltransferase n=1 Tax=unclassified Streptomyces TaxID=2593676 RepID=UPI0008054C5F|nr:GNAT family N-acetyltransferase [Streptomyces sp. MnatMP-M77]MYT79835.1 GNAT family N-acetyltransferase [Streptomyces sp. SID8364]SBV05713.1 Protein N-acetyltransferase, RimJ/RimL family [Streptomyces sp. MnatMP-M77]
MPPAEPSAESDAIPADRGSAGRSGTERSRTERTISERTGGEPPFRERSGGREDGGAGVEDTLDLELTEELLALIAGDRDTGAARTRVTHELLGDPGTWPPAATTAGEFALLPVRPERDLAVVSRWMNDPAVAAFWELAGPESVTADHLRPQLEGDGRSIPCLGVLDGTPMSYWEIYRADLDPLARHYPARPHDTGIHLLIGGVHNRGRGVGTTLLRAVADLVLDNLPLCGRVVAEPDLRNIPSVSAFLSAGFRFSAEVDLPDKRAALMIRDRTYRAQL